MKTSNVMIISLDNQGSNNAKLFKLLKIYTLGYKRIKIIHKIFLINFYNDHGNLSL